MREEPRSVAVYPEFVEVHPSVAANESLLSSRLSHGPPAPIMPPPSNVIPPEASSAISLSKSIKKGRLAYLLISEAGIE